MTAYERECAEKCEWCAKGKIRHESYDDRKPSHYHTGCMEGNYETACTAPTLAESHEALAQALQTRRDEALEEAARLNRDTILWLTRHLEESLKYIPDSDRSGHPHGYSVVQIPDWEVKQKIDWLQQDATEIRKLIGAKEQI